MLTKLMDKTISISHEHENNIQHVLHRSSTDRRSDPQEMIESSAKISSTTDELCVSLNSFLFPLDVQLYERGAKVFARQKYFPYIYEFELHAPSP